MGGSCTGDRRGLEERRPKVVRKECVTHQLGAKAVLASQLSVSRPSMAKSMFSFQDLS